MASVNGSAVLLSVLTSTGPDVYTVIPCQTSAEYNLSVETRDTSCKDSADDTNSPGRRSRTMSVETMPTAFPALSLTPSGVEAILREAAETGDQVTVRINVSGTAKETYTATITSLGMSFPREDTTTMSIDLAISGAPAIV